MNRSIVESLKCGKDIAIVCPTRMRAEYAFKSFAYKYKPIIKSAKHSMLRIELDNGSKIDFLVNSQRELRGLHCSLVSIDEFELTIKEIMESGGQNDKS